MKSRCMQVSKASPAGTMTISTNGNPATYGPGGRWFGRAQNYFTTMVPVMNVCMEQW
jgi:hypothetical protein